MTIKSLLARVGLKRKRRAAKSPGLYQVWEETHLRRLLRHYQVDCVFDVGANYGQYAQMLRNEVGYSGLIVSFEPIPDAVRALREKARGDGKWMIEDLALSSHDGEQRFNIMAGSQFSSLSAPRHDEVQLFRDKNRVAESVLVRTESLATAFHRLRDIHGFHRPFLKLDTQGYDTTIVAHGRSVIAEFIGLQSELAVKKLYQDSAGLCESLELYRSCGFGLSAFVPNNAGHFPRLVEIDCIMVREDLMDQRPPS